ncbi:MAG: hypothetical protein FWF00_02860 [Endomicrobia bacterium]|nr:hypothetical protein [Endomicrobiia bacterium]MCL2506615.1 hypothetical protein [Endomicrobiia bacterium]
MKLKIIFLTAVLLTFNALFAYANEDTPARLNGLRPMSMGGAFTAVADDENAFFYNPAGIAYRQSWMLQILSLDVSINQDLLDFVKFFTDNLDDLKDFNDLTDEQQTDIINKINNEIVGKTPNVGISVPNIAFISSPIQMPKNNSLSWGLGGFSYAQAQFRFNRSLLVPSLSYLAQVTGVVSVPVAYKIDSLEKIKLPGKLSVGATAKYIIRGQTKNDDLSVAEFEDFDFDLQLGKGYGLDFGAIYTLNSQWSFGTVLTDAFYTNIKYESLDIDGSPSASREPFTASIRPRWNIGVAYVPERIYFWPGKYINTNNRFLFAGDLTDIANSDETLTGSFFKKTHFGGEYRLNPLVVRAGFNSGYPTIGFGLVSNVVQFQYAFYGVEEGRYSGQKPSWFHRFVFSIKIGHNDGRVYGGAAKKERQEEKKAEDKKEQAAEDKTELKEEEKPVKVSGEDKKEISNEAEITKVNE